MNKTFSSHNESLHLLLTQEITLSTVKMTSQPSEEKQVQTLMKLVTIHRMEKDISDFTQLLRHI